MSLEPIALTDPREWLYRAVCSLSLAKMRSFVVEPEELIYGARQAVEKAFIACLVGRGVDYKEIQDLTLTPLLQRLTETGLETPDGVKQAARLNRAASPGFAEPLTESEYREAITIAESMITWVEQQIPLE